MRTHCQALFTKPLSTLLLVLSCTVFLPIPAVADSTDFRELWDKAWRGDLSEVEQAINGPLAEHPLRAYLEYALLQQVGRADDDAIAAFLTRYDQTPLADRLRRFWLKELAEQADWGRYIAFWRPNLGVRYDCRQLSAWLALPEALRPPDYLAQIRDLWLVPYSQPDDCDPAFRHWLGDGSPDETIVWQRIEMAIEASQIRLARYLRRHLPPSEHARFALWLDVRRQPERFLPGLQGDDHPRTSNLLAYALQRLMADHPDRVLKWLETPLGDQLRQQDRQRLEHRAIVLLHTRFDEQADEWLETLPPKRRSATLLAWSVRQAMRRQDWPEVEQRIGRLPLDQQEQANWRYWKAMAMREQDPASPVAEQILVNLAGEVSYYGFLAADDLGLDYALCAAQTVEALPSPPNAAINRALRLYEAGLVQHARREWQFGMAGLNDAHKTQAALLADSINWHHAAILGLANAGAWHHYQRRFPLLFEREVQQAAARNGLNPAFLLAIIRAESAFQTDARSPADALGLMQLTEPTARALARRNPALTYRNRWQLINPENNIAFGSFYLRRLFDRFGPDYWAVMAGYNAGPNVAERWRRDTRDLPTAITLETLPYQETRDYVQRVAAFSVIYEWRMQRDIQRVSARLRGGVSSPEKRLVDTGARCGSPLLPDDTDEVITAHLLPWPSERPTESMP
jgi:soluble lytic murein transglycosylase